MCLHLVAFVGSFVPPNWPHSSMPDAAAAELVVVAAAAAAAAVFASIFDQCSCIVLYLCMSMYTSNKCLC